MSPKLAKLGAKSISQRLAEVEQNVTQLLAERQELMMVVTMFGVRVQALLRIAVIRGLISMRQGQEMGDQEFDMKREIERLSREHGTKPLEQRLDYLQTWADQRHIYIDPMEFGVEEYLHNAKLPDEEKDRLRQKWKLDDDEGKPPGLWKAIEIVETRLQQLEELVARRQNPGQGVSDD